MNSINHKDRDPKEVAAMFSGIAAHYDLLNHLLSFGLDFGWRRQVACETGSVQCKTLLDVCTGTGDMAIALCTYWRGNASVEALDFSRALLQKGKEKVRRKRLADRIHFREGDAENLPYEDNHFDGVTITFGLRNIEDRSKALREFYRVTKTGGCFVCLEFSQPNHRVLSTMYPFYLLKVVPLVSSLFGMDAGAYRYLGKTIQDFPAPERLIDIMESAGWSDVSYRLLAGGIVAIHKGKKEPQRSTAS